MWFFLLGGEGKEKGIEEVEGSGEGGRDYGGWWEGTVGAVGERSD